MTGLPKFCSRAADFVCWGISFDSVSAAFLWPNQPIDHYGIIGNMYHHSVGRLQRFHRLVMFSKPRFSQRVCPPFWNDKKGGQFIIEPKCATAEEHSRITTKQLYWPATNVLITRFLASHGVGEIIDFYAR